MDSPLYYLTPDGTTVGPVSRQELLRRLRNGLVHEAAQIASATNPTEWLPVSVFLSLPDPGLKSADHSHTTKNDSQNREKIRCPDCGLQFIPELTQSVGFGRRLCLSCAAARHPRHPAPHPTRTGPRSTRFSKAALLAAITVAFLLLAAAARTLVYWLDLPIPYITDNAWILSPPEHWPPLICLADFHDPAGQRIICGTAFLAQQGSAKKSLLTASRNLLMTSGDQPQQRTPEEVNWALQNLTFLPHNGSKLFPLHHPSATTPRTFIKHDVLVFSSESLPPVVPLRLRSHPAPPDTNVRLIAPPAEIGGPQRGLTGIILHPGDDQQYGQVAMDQVFPASWFLGAPFVDRSGRLVGMLVGELPPDLSKVTQRNILLFISAERLKSLIVE